ncbi:MAG: UpxY family transcription antiterminator [Prevotella sp.]|nr:UpxY family transcription antiterminator [Prevotella sp.]
MDDPKLSYGRPKAIIWTAQSYHMQNPLPWYAIRLFSLHYQEAIDFLTQQGLETFVPMESITVRDHDGRLRHHQRPVVRNIIFVQKKYAADEMRKIFASAAFKMAVYTKASGSYEYYEIPAKEMFEFQVMCNLDKGDAMYCSESEVALKKGTPVIVEYGPLKGMTGKLVRASKKYYLLKQIPGVAVMLKVTRWCCKPIVTGSQ